MNKTESKMNAGKQRPRDKKLGLPKNMNKPEASRKDWDIPFPNANKRH
jgi:hypothetical protein